MKPEGWVFLIAALGFVWGLAGWCFWKVLSLPPDSDGKDSAE